MQKRSRLAKQAEDPIEQLSYRVGRVARAVEQTGDGAQQITEQVTGTRHRIHVQRDLGKINLKAEQIKKDRAEV